MSRTDKDRPTWVVQNDRTLGPVEHHDHTRLGTTHRRRVVPGERTLVEYGEHTWILRHTDGTPGMTVEEDRAAHRYYPTWGVFRAGTLRWYYERPTRYEWVGRVEVEVTAPDHCTISDPVRSDREYWAAPCRVGAADRSHRCTVTKEMRRREYHKPMRRQVAAAMNRFAAEYNTFGDVDDSTWQDTQHRHAPFGGGWWD